MSISESSPASTAQNPSINDSNSKPSKPKFKCSIRSMVSNFSAKRSISKQKPFDVQKNDHRAASSEATTSKSDDHGGALSLPLVRRDLLMLDSAFADAKKYMDHVDLQINQLHEKLKELQGRVHSEGDIAQLWKAIVKLKMKIPSQKKIHSAVSNPNHDRWLNINNAEDEMMHFYYKEPRIAHTSDSDAMLKAFHDLPNTLRLCLELFFYFPPMAIIKRRVIIYLWIGIRINTYCQMIEYSPENILDELSARGFLEPVHQKCSLVPDSCRMSLSVRHSLNKKVIYKSNHRHLNLDVGLFEHQCLVNVGEAIIDGPPEIFDTMQLVRCVYLGRWQSSAKHHIEIADVKILHGLKKLTGLKFLSLQGISLITELPSSISKLFELKILDLRACHNLEMIPENIGCLTQLTHLDMSECYFLVHMPESLAQLLSLEVLKGFFLRHYNSNKPSCTLHDLSSLKYLIKLNIYTSMNDFPKLSDLDSFERFRQLQKLTVLWGGFSLQGESDTSTEGIILSHQSTT